MPLCNYPKTQCLRLNRSHISPKKRLCTHWSIARICNNFYVTQGGARVNLTTHLKIVPCGCKFSMKFYYFLHLFYCQSVHNAFMFPRFFKDFSKIPKRFKTTFDFQCKQTRQTQLQKLKTKKLKNTKRKTKKQKQKKNQTTKPKTH